MTLKKKYRDNVILKGRAVLVMAVVFVLLFLLVVQLGRIMIGKSEEYKDMATKQWTDIIKIDPKRGKILDRNGKELAISANVYKIYVDLTTLRKDLERKNLTMEDISPDVADILEMDKDEVFKMLTKKLPNGKPYGGTYLKRRIEKSMRDELLKYIDKTKLYGFVISDDSKRYYPNNEFLSHVLGHTRSDGVGLTGVELMYDKYLTGIPGFKMAEVDATRQIDMPYVISDYTKPVQGRNVILTIDMLIQHFIEKAAEEALANNKAKAVTIVVMEPNTGEILGLVNKPDYNPNNPWITGDYLEDQKAWRNRAVSDAFEPGSIFKVVTATAALSEGKVSDSDTFVCNGSTRVGNRTIHCHKRTGHGTQTFAEILQNSCNMGFIELGKRLGPEVLTKYIKLFGLGQKTGVDMNGESSGIVKAAENVTETDLATISFGQTNTLSIMQYMRAFNALANGGYLVTPHVMKEITHYDEDNSMIVDKTFTVDKKQVIDSKVAASMRQYLEKVISEGGGKKAYIPGYHIGGKTGTAQKINTERPGYAAGKYIASFAGMAPASNPKITVMISIDEPDPSNYYAGQIATPVAKQIFNDIFNYLAFQPDATGDEIAESLLKDEIIPEARGLDKNDAIKILRESNLNYRFEGDGKFVTDMNPKPGYSVKEGTEIILYTSNNETAGHNVLMPDLKGMEKSKAERVIKNLGLNPKFIGEGVVSDQVPKPGIVVGKGTIVTIYLEYVTD